MAGYTNNEKLLIYIFYESLTDEKSKWYLRLKKDQISTWRDLIRAFLEHYKYMLNTAPDRLTLQNMKKGSSESYKEYTIRWKNVSLLV